MHIKRFRRSSCDFAMYTGLLRKKTSSEIHHDKSETTIQNDVYIPITHILHVEIIILYDIRSLTIPNCKPEDDR